MLRLAFVGAATAEAIGELLIKKGIITGAELSEAFLDSLEKNIKHYKGVGASIFGCFFIWLPKTSFWGTTSKTQIYNFK